MKRDMDLIRSILLACEDHEHGYAPEHIEIDGYTTEQIGFHVYLLGEAGYMKVADTSSFESLSPKAVPLSVTHFGFEFLESIRDETVWQETQGVLSKVGTWTLSLVSRVASEVATRHAMAAIGSP